MIKKDISKIQNTFYASLVLVFTLSSLLKSDYSTSIPLDFGGYSSETEISLVINPKVSYSSTISYATNKSFTLGPTMKIIDWLYKFLIG